MGTFIEKCFGFYQVRKELEARISGLENENTELLREKEYLVAETSELKDANNQLRQALGTSNAQLAQAKENIAEEKTELERKMAHLKSLEATDKSELDLQNWRFKSVIEDLKRQNRKLEEENIALKERAYGLNEQLFTLQPQKPQ
ncbi:hypothetical protein HpNP137_00360 [Helicobacter pylori]